jgi:metal-responsive CopG/Arc/MetJ family transcriptional regulator
MKTAVSIPDRVFQSADKLAARLGVSRSELYAKALAALVEKHREDVVTAQLNEVYSPEGEQSSIDRDVALLQSRSLPHEKW